MEEFLQGNPEDVYARMRPDQRTAIAGEFVRLFRLSNEPGAQEFLAPYSGMLPAARVAAMHRWASTNRPDIVDAVLHHPVTATSLQAPGVLLDVPADDHERAAIPTDDPALPERRGPGLLP